MCVWFNVCVCFCGVHSNGLHYSSALVVFCVFCCIGFIVWSTKFVSFHICVCCSSCCNMCSYFRMRVLVDLVAYIYICGCMFTRVAICSESIVVFRFCMVLLYLCCHMFSLCVAIWLYLQLLHVRRL